MMRRPEGSSSVFPYVANLLSRVSGVETFIEARRAWLDRGASGLAATSNGVIEGLGSLLLPAMTRDRENPRMSGFVPDLWIGAIAPLYFLGETPNIKAALLTRVGYHFAVEVIPDAFRALKRREDPVLNAIRLLSE